MFPLRRRSWIAWFTLAVGLALWVTLAPQLQLGDQNMRRQQTSIAILLVLTAVFPILRARRRDRQ
jgi:hypothetical protein